jgi:hypothetical protein
MLSILPKTYIHGLSTVEILVQIYSYIDYIEAASV